MQKYCIPPFNERNVFVLESLEVRFRGIKGGVLVCSEKRLCCSSNNSIYAKLYIHLIYKYTLYFALILRNVSILTDAAAMTSFL